jgi:hypothetical protein
MKNQFKFSGTLITLVSLLYMMLLLSFKCVHVQLVLCASQIFKKIKMILNHDKSILFLYLGLKDIVSLLCMMLPLWFFVHLGSQKKNLLIMINQFKFLGPQFLLLCCTCCCSCDSSVCIFNLFFVHLKSLKKRR